MSTGNQTFRRRLRWVVVNTAFAVAAYYGVAEGVEWAANVFKFGLWFTVAMTLLMAVTASAPGVRANLAKGPSVPLSLNLAYDLALAFFLAAFGWFGYATLAVVQGIIQGAVYQGAQKPAGSPVPGEGSDAE